MGLRNFFNVILYVKLSPDTITVRDVYAGYEIVEQPLVAIMRESKNKIVGIGNEATLMAAGHTVDFFNPFKHPRALLSDFTTAEILMKYCVTKVLRNYHMWMLRPAPIIVLHPMIDPEGGFTQIEVRAMRELAVGAGGRKIFIWQGRELDNGELAALKFESGGTILN